MILSRSMEAGTLETVMGGWYVGQRVVCVDNGFLDFSDAPELTEGAIYTVVEILPKKRGFFGLRVKEVEAKEKYHAFDERRFRPLTEAAVGRSFGPRWIRSLVKLHTKGDIGSCCRFTKYHRCYDEFAAARAHNVY